MFQLLGVAKEVRHKRFRCHQSDISYTVYCHTASTGTCLEMEVVSRERYYETKEVPFKITSVVVKKQLMVDRWSQKCTSSRFGFYGRTVWVRQGCGAVFTICSASTSGMMLHFCTLPFYFK